MGGGKVDVGFVFVVKIDVGEFKFVLVVVWMLFNIGK